MKTIIKKLLRDGLLDEGMLNSTNLPKETALFSKNDKLYLSLYDPMTRTTYGMISASLRGQNYDMDNVAAEKGLGPYMYELAIMTAGSRGKGLMPARNGDIREQALKIWEKMYDRGDVKKQSIPPFDVNGNWNPNYSIALWTGDDETFDSPEEFDDFWVGVEPSGQELLKKFNTVYSMAPSHDYEEMQGRADAYIKKGMNPERAFNGAQILFMDKYD